jgi:hypothetical protein
MAVAEYAYHPAAGYLSRIYFIPVSTETCVSPSKGLFTKKLSPLGRIYRVFALQKTSPPVPQFRLSADMSQHFQLLVYHDVLFFCASPL